MAVEGSIRERAGAGPDHEEVESTRVAEPDDLFFSVWGDANASLHIHAEPLAEGGCLGNHLLTGGETVLHRTSSRITPCPSGRFTTWRANVLPPLALARE